MSSQQLFLDETYIIDGVTVTGEDIKNAMIDSMIYRKHLGGDDEWVSLQDLNFLVLMMMSMYVMVLVVKPAQF